MIAKQKQRMSVVIVTLLVVVGMVAIGKVADAADTSPLGFEVTPVLPDTQIDKEKNYFYVETRPGIPQTLKVNVKGLSEEPTKVRVFMANAITSEGGTVAYKAGVEKDPTLQDSIEDLVTVDTPEFEIKKGEERTITLTVTPPATSFEGIKLGTIYFQQVEPEQAKQQAVQSTYSYRIGVMLTEKEEEYSNSKSLNLLSAEAELSHSFKTIQLTFQNPEPKMIADVTMNLSIIDKKTGKVIKKQKLENGSIAPNSRFKLGIDWGIDAIPVGKYQAKVEATSRYDSWSLEKDFEITAATAKKMNDESLNKLTLPSWAYGSILGLGILVVVDSVYLAMRQKQWKKQLIQRKKKAKRKGKKNEHEKSNA